MSGRAFWGSGRLPLTRAAGGRRLFYKSYKSYKSYILGVADKPDPKKRACSVRQAHGSAALNKTPARLKAARGAKHPFYWRLNCAALVCR